LAALLHGSQVVSVSQTAALNRGRHLCLAGRPSRLALAHILVKSYFLCACAETAIYELPVKILTPAFDSLTLISLWERYFGDLKTFSVDFCTG